MYSLCAFFLLQALAPFQVALGELIARRIDGRVFIRLMSASLRSTGIGPLEDRELLDELGEATWELETGFQSPGRACAGLLSLITRYAQLAGYAICIGIGFSWIAAGGILIVVLIFRHGQRGGLRKYTMIFRRLAHIRRRNRYLRDLASHAPAAKEIRVFGLTGLLRERYRDQYLAFLSPVWAERRRVYLGPYLGYTAIGVVICGAVLALVGDRTAGTPDVAHLALVLQAALAAIRLGDFYPEADTQTQLGMLSLKGILGFEAGLARYGPITGAAPVVNPADGASCAAPRIEFHNVSFRYPGSDRSALDNLNLTVTEGKCTAIVGLNGAGKTTLVKLLARLYEPTAGTILVDGRDLPALPVEAWRRRLAVIFQDFIHFEASVADNIAFGSVEHIDDAESIFVAAHAAGIGELTETLPGGYGTPLSRIMTGGTELSGGQWQRVALARALFALRHGASVLILDEPTANLDVRAEARFYSDLMRLGPRVTTILISHRFATIRQADTIFVIDDGHVLEQGTHDHLMALDGQYAKLFRMQAERFSDGGETADDYDPEGIITRQAGEA